MASFVACDLTISLDGFPTGPNQTLERPFGEGEGDLQAGAIEEPRLHIAPMLPGAESGFDGVSGLRLEPLAARQTRLVTHVLYRVLRD